MNHFMENENITIKAKPKQGKTYEGRRTGQLTFKESKMNDEITKVFDEKFYKQYFRGKVGEKKTKEAIQEEVDNFSNQFENDLQSSVPKDTGGLAKSLTKVKQQRVDWYGYNFEFKGENKDGVPYEKIATF